MADGEDISPKRRGRWDIAGRARASTRYEGASISQLRNAAKLASKLHKLHKDAQRGGAEGTSHNLLDVMLGSGRSSRGSRSSPFGRHSQIKSDRKSQASGKPRMARFRSNSPPKVSEPPADSTHGRAPPKIVSIVPQIASQAGNPVTPEKLKPTKSRGEIAVPAIPTRQYTQAMPMNIQQIDAAIGDAAYSSKVRKYKNTTEVGKIMRTGWAHEQQAQSPDARDSRAMGLGSPRRAKAPRSGRMLNRMRNIGFWSRRSSDDLATLQRPSEASHCVGQSSEQSEGGPASASQPTPLNRNMRSFDSINPSARTRPLEGHHPVHPYECLVFKGGGAKGSIYPGAVRALEDAGIMPYVKRFAGASAGAVVAALLAIGLSAKQLYRELANTDLYNLIKDAENTASSLYSLVTKFGMNPGTALYRYLGLLFYKYVGNADVTFRQLYETYGVELAICVTNVTRASAELLHVKTSPDYPIRKAVRMSMSLPMIIQPCRERNVHGMVHEENLTSLTSQQRHAMRGQLYKLVNQQRVAQGRSSIVRNGSHDQNSGSTAEAPGVSERGEDGLEYYVDGGVLSNYPIDAFDGWWLSMKPEDSFYRNLIGTNCHANYINRFEGHNPYVLGFRLNAAAEPDSMQARLGNDKLELKVREMESASLPHTNRSEDYAVKRDELTSQAKERLQLDDDLRVSMDWLKNIHSVWDAPSADGNVHELLATVLECKHDLRLMVRRANPPDELMRVLGFESADTLAKALQPIHETLIKGFTGETPSDVPFLKEDVGISDPEERQALMEFQMVIYEIEKCLERLGESFMSRLVGATSAETPSLEKFFMRLIDAIQTCNDERVQTKANMRRTCMLDTEYVGVVDFKLEDGDFDFLWRKGYATTVLWLEKRIEKRKAEVKVKDKGGVMGAGATQVAMRRTSIEATAAECEAPAGCVQPGSATALAPVNADTGKAWAKAAAWALSERREAERRATALAAIGDQEEINELTAQLEVKDEALHEALERCELLQGELAMLKAQSRAHVEQTQLANLKADALAHQLSSIQNIITVSHSMPHSETTAAPANVATRSSASSQNDAILTSASVDVYSVQLNQLGRMEAAVNASSGGWSAALQSSGNDTSIMKAPRSSKGSIVALHGLDFTPPPPVPPEAIPEEHTAARVDGPQQQQQVQQGGDGFLDFITKAFSFSLNPTSRSE